MAVFHILPDILLWFDGVGILWPFASIDLWRGVHLGETAQNLLRAGNFAAFAVYLSLLSRLLPDESVKRCAWVQWGLAGLFGIAALVLPRKTYNLCDGAALLLFAYPSTLWLTWKHRQALEAG